MLLHSLAAKKRAARMNLGAFAMGLRDDTNNRRGT
jgi:hypothetical protein